MSIEKDNLPEADGLQENNAQKKPSTESDNNSADETTGKAPIQVEIEPTAESKESAAIDHSKKEEPSTEQTVNTQAAADMVDSVSSIEEKDTAKAEDVSEVSSQVTEDEATTGEAPIEVDIEPAADELKEDIDKLPQQETDQLEESLKAEGDNIKEMVKNAEDTKDFHEDADQDQAEGADTEDETEEDNSETKVPLKDYDEMSLGDLVVEAGDLLASYSVLKLKDAFNQIKDTFRKKADEAENLAKEKFLASGGNEIDFRHDNPHHVAFYDRYSEYKSKLDKHYQAIEAEQKENLKERQAIIDELKALYTEPSTENSQIFKKFRELKTRWHNAGRIPKAEAGNIFKTYYFHLNNFHEFLDMNHELRVMDYDHNLEVRKSIIERAKKLLDEDNVQKALNEIQYLHRMWKEEAVPVAEEFRETTWQTFKDITSKIHDRKNELNKQLLERQKENLEKKHNIIAEIDALLEGEKPKTHNHWQKKIKSMKALRESFFAIGRVPKEHNQPTWDKFKEASRKFNKEKNNFYKQLKAEQMENLEKKKALLAIAQECKDSSDWNKTVNEVKRIQAEWKKIGHVPRKYSDKIWKEFSDANNKFFDRYKNRNNEKIEKQKENLEKKQAFLDDMAKSEKPSDKDELIQWLNKQRISWSSIGYVPNGKQDINKDFNKLTKKILEDAGISKDAVEKAQWNGQIEQIKTNLDERLLKDLKFDVRKQMDEVQKEVTQLQTNLAFFSNADDSNPLFKNAIQNIENKVAELKALESKFDDLRLINLEALAENQPQDEAGEGSDNSGENATENDETAS